MEKGNGSFDRPLPSQRTSNADVMDIGEDLKHQLNYSEMDVDDDSGQGSNSSLSDSATDNEILFAATKRISNEQKKLSYQERNFINEEIHGVACNVQDESPEMVQYSLSKLTSELEDLVLTDWRKNATGPSTLSAGFLLSRRDFGTDTYVNRPSFRLRFLRSENFDVQKAAIRLMKFLNLVLEVFGAYALSRPIKLTDFKRSELKALQSGWLQVLPFRDRSGRRLFIWTGRIGMQYDPILRVRQIDVSCQGCLKIPLSFSQLFIIFGQIKITIYMMMAGTRDIESQRKGIVCMVFPGRFQQSPQFSFNALYAFKTRHSHLVYMSYANRAIEAIPVKCRALHYCLFLDEKKRLNPIQKLSIDMTRRTMSYMLPRTKLHVGKIWILVYDLDQFQFGNGIPVFVTSIFAHSIFSLSLVRKCLDPIVVLLQTKAEQRRFEIFYQAMECR